MKLKKYGFFHKLWLLQWSNDPTNIFLYFLNWFTFFPIWFILIGYVKIVNSMIGHLKWNKDNQDYFKEWLGFWRANQWTVDYGVTLFAYFLLILLLAVNSILLSSFVLGYILWPFSLMLVIECIAMYNNIECGKTKVSFIQRKLSRKSPRKNFLRKNIDIIE